MDQQGLEQEDESKSDKDSTSNIHRRYRRLFTLPARNRVLGYSSAIVLANTLVSRLALKAPPEQITLYLVATEIVLLLGVEIDVLTLKGRNKVATYRRLVSLTIPSNAIWLVLSIVGFAVFVVTGDTSRFLSLVILGAFFAIAFRAMVLGSLFYRRPLQGIPLAIVQPILIFIPTAFESKLLTFTFWVQSLNPVTAIVGGIIALIGAKAYMESINKIRVGDFRPLELLQAFLNAWAEEDPIDFERLLDATSKEQRIESKLLSVSTAQGDRALIIVPGVHPGPFYPIGSSNIPGDIFMRLRSNKEIPMIVHSMSAHELNLPSKIQVERYISSLESKNMPIDMGSRMTLPATEHVGKATVNGMAFGSTLVITVTQAPYGMEDFPSKVSEEIEGYSSAKGFKNALVIDAHNSEGPKPNEKECSDAIEAARRVVDRLSGSGQFEFRAGVAHSSELKEAIEESDIGPAGVGVIMFEIENSETFSLVVSDSNNSLIGFREKVFDEFEKRTGSKILEICTSDTHVTAAKTSDAKGYLSLGDRISHEKFSAIVAELYEKAKENSAIGSFTSSLSETYVKTIGSQVLDNFSGLLDLATAKAKHGAKILGAAVLAITIVVALI